MNEISNILPATIPLPKSSVAHGQDGTNRTVVTPTVANTVSTTSTNASALTANSEKTLNAETIKSVVEAANTKLQASSNNLKFKVDETTKQVVVSIVDTETNEVIRQIPTVEMLDFMQAMALQESNKGNLYTKTV